MFFTSLKPVFVIIPTIVVELNESGNSIVFAWLRWGIGFAF